MPTSLVESESLLAVDVGATATRAALFDVVEGSYRLLAVGQAPTTAEAPFRDLGLGVRDAIEAVQTVTGRVFLDKERRLVMPAQADGSGVDGIVATLSAGPSIRTAVVGLLSDVSLESARRLVETTYCRVVETLELNDHRRPEEQIDDLLRARPELVVLSGGTDGGASRSVQKMLEAVGLTCYLMPSEKRPVILFAGNQSLSSEVQTLMGNLTPALHFSPNVRPSLDTEDLDPAARELAQLLIVARRGQLNGIEELEMWTKGHILPTSYALGRMVRFLPQLTGASAGVLGVDIGVSAATIAAGFNSRLSLHTYPQYGLGENLAMLMKSADLEGITRWLTLDLPEAAVRDFLFQKSFYPSTLPATVEDLAVSQAVTRQNLRLAVESARRDFPPEMHSLRPDLLPYFELIVASGGALADAPTLGQSMLMLLDTIQPIGLTHIILDKSNLLPLLGAAAEQNSLLPVQVLESGAFEHLGTAVSVVGNAGYGTPILRARMLVEGKNEARVEVKFGGLEALPLGLGQTARIHLQPLQHADVGFGSGRSQTVAVNGGVLGVVIDARGRPLQFTPDAVRRRELMKKWLWTLGG